MQKKELALQVIERLKKEYPDTGCSLDYDDAWKLLVSVRLAAQCTDARVNVVVQDLYREFPDVDALADADVEEIERIVKPCGLGHSKARDISACMKMLKGSCCVCVRHWSAACIRELHPALPAQVSYRLLFPGIPTPLLFFSIAQESPFCILFFYTKAV